MSTLLSKNGINEAMLRRKKHLRHVRNGFTLVEVLATVAMLTFGLVAILNLHAATMIGSSIASHSTMATNLAESQSEYLQTLAAGQLSQISEDPEYLTVDGLPCTPPTDPDDVPCFFTRTTTITSGVPLTNSTTASIKLEWGDDKVFIYDTIVGRFILANN